MSCNCPTPNQCTSQEQCLCGIDLSIYNPEGVLVEVSHGNKLFKSDFYFEVTESTAFTSLLGPGYVLIIQYNESLGRWELSYTHPILDISIIIGVVYTDQTECPILNCWDLDCIAVSFNVLGISEDIFSWNGAYTNGKKSYTFISDWSGSNVNYRIYWTSDSSTLPSSGAPANTPAWVLEEEVSPGVWQPAGYLFNNNPCPYGQYIVEFGGLDTRFSFTDLGVTGYDMNTSVTNCGCCDTELIVTINGVDYTASVEYDEYGNILGENGKQYYKFEWNDLIYYIYFDGSQWVIGLNCLENFRITEDGIYRATESGDLRIIE